MKQSMKLAARILENLPVMSPDVMQEWIDNPTGLQEFLAPLAPAGEQLPENPTRRRRNRYLNHIATARIAPTTGSTTLALASDVFTGYLDPNFLVWNTNVFGLDTEEISADIYEINKDGSLATLFGSFGLKARLLCLTQGQIREFCRTNYHLLRQDGYATFFIFEVNTELFVASVHVDVGQLAINLKPFGDYERWNAAWGPRLVVSQVSAQP